jgi:hypothetical protein
MNYSSLLRAFTSYQQLNLVIAREQTGKSANNNQKKGAHFRHLITIYDL